KGYILTNSHVVSDGQAVDVKVLFNDGSTTQGKVLWNDAKLDLAMVKVDKTGLTAAELGDSDQVRVGDIAIAIGNPLGLEFQKSVTQGIISGLDRTIQTEKETMTGLMQTDASINPGNSGGPLLNEKGQVIGINSAKVSSAEGIGFSIPINTAKPIIEQVIKSGNFEKVTLGIKGIDVTTFESSTGTDLAADEGVYIVEVVSDTPAQKSGIQAGDVIVKVGNDETPTMTDLNKVLYKYKSGQSTKVTVNRSGKEVTVDIKF
ncbi:MAG: S1C family serine protease, partial [Romboutsia timonensis]